jgi:NtrC-family two-component system response regulator AlgB
LRFFERRQGRHHLSFSPRCEEALVRYPWPGNLRELRNAVERALILSPSTIVELQDLGLPFDVALVSPEHHTDGVTNAVRGRALTPTLGEECSLEEIEREHIARVVARAPSFEAAARILGIDPTTLQRKRKRYGLA